MKTTRSELKNIIKECLIEILSEGLGDSPRLSESLRTRSQLSSPRTDTRSPSPALREAVRRESGGDRVLESILSDTAASTLPQMLEGEKSKRPAPIGRGIAEQVVAAASPEDLFGEDTTSKWADLAFMNSREKK